jgi:rod shape-determining protein MreC
LKRKKYFVPLLVIIFFSICLITLSIKGIVYPINLPERFIVSLFVPIQTKIVQGLRKILGGWEHYIYLVNAREENELLKKQVGKLLSENSRFIEMEKSYERLVKVLKFKQSLKFKTIAAEVTGRDSNGWLRTIYINKGSRHGIEKDTAVVAPNGLVGRVIVAASNSSKVLLLTDIRSSVAALVQRSRSSGIVTGNATQDLEMEYLNRDADVEVGDRIISSGLGGIFPKGLLIGRVKRITEENSGFFLDAVIIPNVNIGKLEEVLVIIVR